MSGRYVTFQGQIRNIEYRVLGSEYEHVFVWRSHHGVTLNPQVYIIHHKDHDKQNNTVCLNASPCLDWECGNLAAMTRSDHIREHKPGRMGGEHIPNKKGRKEHHCKQCGVEKSKRGDICRSCYRASVGA